MYINDPLLAIQFVHMYDETIKVCSTACRIPQMQYQYTFNNYTKGKG